MNLWFFDILFFSMVTTVSQQLKRTLFFLLMDIIVLSAVYVFSLRTFFNTNDHFFISPLHVFLFLGLICFITIGWLSYFRLYTITWRYVGLREFINTSFALLFSNMTLYGVLILLRLYSIELDFSLSLVIVNGSISLIGIAGVRIAKRVYLEIFSHKKRFKDGMSTLIIGAGNTGEMIVRDWMKQPHSVFHPKVFLDDDSTKKNIRIHGIKVEGGTELLQDKIEEHNIEAVIIAIPSLNFKILRNIYNLAKEAGISIIKVVPRIYDFHQPNVTIKSLEDIKIEDLIGRQKVDVDYDEISGFVRDKCVLISGAGGSIGSEIVRQVCAFEPSRIVLFEIDETDLHTLNLQLKRLYPHLFGEKKRIEFIVGDIRDDRLVGAVFDEFKPHLVFHAAAYKHVPMMEWNVTEAVKVNMFGTEILAKHAVSHHVQKFIMISTDKAVRPTSIMGASKRMAEYICKAYNGYSRDNNGSTQFVSVRFGNVLGSRGSILPLFMEQLSYGGPLTITHKDMKRYFMTIPEAVSLVLQAAIIGKGGEVMVLDMGEPIKITKLAEELIKIHGLEPYKDIDTEFVGLRPGEKLFEEILTAEEGTRSTQHQKVFVAQGNDGFSIQELDSVVSEFRETLTHPFDRSHKDIRDLLKKYVKHYEEE